MGFTAPGYLRATPIREFWNSLAKAVTPLSAGPHDTTIETACGVTKSLDDEMLRCGFWTLQGLNRQIFRRRDVEKLITVLRRPDRAPLTCAMLLHPKYGAWHYSPNRRTIGLLSVMTLPADRGRGLAQAALSAIGQTLLRRDADPATLGDFSIAASSEVLPLARRHLPMPVVADWHQTDDTPPHIVETQAFLVRSATLRGEEMPPNEWQRLEAPIASHVRSSTLDARRVMSANGMHHARHADDAALQTRAP